MTKRRKILKIFSAVGASSAVWTKPVVESVLLPAHAEMSNDITATVQFFTDSFGMEITSDPPQVEIGTPFNLLITTNTPNTNLYYALYGEDGMRTIDPASFGTDDDGVAALAATPLGPAGEKRFVLTDDVDTLVIDINTVDIEIYVGVSLYFEFN